jgi:ligand-binding sensor domain-containing protein
MIPYRKLVIYTWILIISVTTLLSRSIVQAASPNNLVFGIINKEQGLSHNSVWTIIQDHYGYMWFGTEAGLDRYDGAKFEIYNYDPTSFTSLPGSSVISVCETHDDQLWVSTYWGISKYNRETKSFTSYFNDPADPNSTMKNAVKVIYEDSYNVLWLGTSAGLASFDRETKIFTYYFDGIVTNNVEGNPIQSIYEDSRKILW